MNAKPKPKKGPINPNNMQRFGLSDEQAEKLEQMAVADRRKKADFWRVLLEQEWDRRHGAAAAAPAAPAA